MITQSNTRLMNNIRKITWMLILLAKSKKFLCGTTKDKHSHQEHVLCGLDKIIQRREISLQRLGLALIYIWCLNSR